MSPPRVVFPGDETAGRGKRTAGDARHSPHGAVAGDGLLVGQQRHLVHHHPQAGRVVGRIGPGGGEHRVERVGSLGQQRLGELGEQLALAGLHREPGGVAHDEAEGDRLQQRHLGRRRRGHDEVGGVPDERGVAVRGAGGVGRGDDEPAHQPAGQALQRELTRRRRDPRGHDVRHHGERPQLPRRLGERAGLAAEVAGGELDEHVALGRGGQRGEVDPAGDEAVLDVVHGVGHVVGPVHDLRLQAPPPRGSALAHPGEHGGVHGVGAVLALPPLAHPGVLARGVQRGTGEVQPTARDLELQPRQDAQRLRVALEAAAGTGELVEGAFAVVPERRVADVVREPGGVDDVGVAPRSSAMPRPIWATSRECVSRVRGTPLTSAPSPGPTTCVLPASRRNAAECSTRARSRENGLRRSTRPGCFAGSGTRRARSCSP